MAEIGRYVLSVGAAALIAGILSDFTDRKGTIGMLIRMVCGLFLAIVVIHPISSLNYDHLTAFAEDYDRAAQSASAEGIKFADTTRRELIQSQTEAYILDKASSYNVQLEVQVTLADGDVPVPESVQLSGEASPYAKQRLVKYMAEELGIPKERQQWIG